MSYFSQLQENRQIYIKLIDDLLYSYTIDLKELGNDTLGSPYRDFQTRSCDCWGILSPDEEMDWHVSHIKMCLTSSDEIQSFYEQFCILVEKESEKFRSKKEKVVDRFKIKAQEKGLELWDIYKKNKGDYLFCDCDILYNKDLSNSKKLEAREQEWVKEIEKISGQAQTNGEERKKQEEKNEKIRKEEETKQQGEQEEWKRKIKQDKEKWEKEHKNYNYPEEQSSKEQKDFLHLSSLIQNCQDLDTLEKNYQIVKNNPLYSSDKETFVGHGRDNKARLDNFYTIQKNYLQPNHQKNNSPTNQQQPSQPLIDTTEIEQAENTNEAITIIKIQIIQALKNHNLKTTDLPKKYHNWEEQLTKLTTKEQINSLVVEISQQIENKAKELKGGQNQKSNNKKQSFSLGDKIGLGILLSSVILLIIIISWAVIKSKKNKKR